MRHSTGSWLIRSGVDIRTAAAILRHSATSTTVNIYAHEQHGAQAEAMERLDRHMRGADGNRMATATGSKREETLI
jgi:site-specific recombinase XerD